MHRLNVIPAEAGIQKNKHKSSKFFKLKARFMMDSRLRGNDIE
ncbi:MULTISPECIES: hypothetical protein [unclassified Rickettsia]|nr:MULTISPECIES: hypothetical protein [unclassified Rickettsia]